MENSLKELLEAVRSAEGVTQILLKLRWFAEDQGVASHRVQDLINSFTDHQSSKEDVEQICLELDVFTANEALEEIRRMVDEIDTLQEQVTELGNDLERAEAEIARLNEGQ